MWLFNALNATFSCKKTISKVFTFWHVQTDITYKIVFGILHIDAIKENSEKTRKDQGQTLNMEYA